MENRRSLLASYIKGISITGIVLYHLIAFYLNVPGSLKIASSFGGAGVHMFIICSGFGLMLSYLNKPLTWITFMRRRFFKIYVPYIIVVTISLFVPFMYMADDRFGAWLSHVFLYKMFLPQYESSFGVQFWYISTIIQFYIVFVLLAKIKQLVGNRKYLFISVVMSVIWIVFTICMGLYEERIWSSFFLQYLWEFSIGMCLADMFIKKDTEFLRKIALWKIVLITAIALCLFGLLSLSGGVGKSVNDVFSCLAFGGICLILYRLRFLHKLFWGIDRFSYEWYLVHILVFEVCFWMIPAEQCNLLMGVLALIVSILAAGVYEYLKTMIERKLRKAVACK